GSPRTTSRRRRPWCGRKTTGRPTAIYAGPQVARNSSTPGMGSSIDEGRQNAHAMVLNLLNGLSPRPYTGSGGALEGYDLRCIRKLPNVVRILSRMTQYALGA